MIGTMRLVLAVLVAANHLYLPTANRVGAHAVAAFYILSGYLMTRVINEVYGKDAAGTGRFLLNRFLRIYPPYWTFLALSMLLLWLFPTTFGQTHSSMQLPATGYDWFRNVSLYNLPPAPARMIPPAWTLTVEVFFYIAMALLLSRWRALAALWWVVSIIITIWLIVQGAPFGQRYTPTYAASVFFATGACLYFVYPQARRLAMPVSWAWALFGLFCVAPLLVAAAGLPFGMIGFYGPALVFVFILITAIPAATTNLDRRLGDLAYPVFISHFFGAGVLRILWPTLQPLSLPFFLLSVAVSFAVSMLFVALSQRWLEPARARVRHA